MLEIPSLLRQAEHKALSRITLSGSVLDLGGDSRSAYRSVFKGDYRLTTINADPAAGADIIHDLERPLPVKDALYEGVLIINVLEHIFEYRQLLTEAVRTLKPGGTLVVVVPFLFPLHPSPKDFFRFTTETLYLECKRLALEEITITPLGNGVFSARYLLLERLLPWPVRLVGYFSVRFLSLLLDAALVLLSRALNKKYDPAHYALGYCLTARKTSNI